MQRTNVGLSEREVSIMGVKNPLKIYSIDELRELDERFNEEKLDEDMGRFVAEIRRHQIEVRERVRNFMIHLANLENDMDHEEEEEEEEEEEIAEAMDH